MSQIAPDFISADHFAISTSFSAAFAWPLARDAAIGPSAKGGSVTDVQPVGEVIKSVAGSLGLSFADIFYNRILFEPAEISVGNLLAAQTRTMRVFNAYLSHKSFSAAQLSDGDGIAVTMPDTPPFSFKMLREMQIEFAVGLEGPFVIAATFSVTIGGVVFVIPITGNRLTLFPFPPNWKGGCAEVSQWRTNIMRAYSGAEQRRQLSAAPRVELSYDLLLSGLDAARFDNLMWGWQNRGFGVPFWPDRASTTAVALQDSRIIPVNTEGYSFTEGALAVLFASSSECEIAEITAVSQTSITLSSTLARDWPAGSIVYPAFVGHLPVALQSRRLTDSLLMSSISFTAAPASFNGYLPTGAPGATLNGVEVLLDRPNWAGDLIGEHQFQHDVVDYGGDIFWGATESTPRIMRQFRWLLADRAAIRKFREFIMRLKGMAKACYIPSWTSDFKLLSPAAASDSFIFVDDPDFDRFVGVTPARDGLMLRLKDGTVILRSVAGVSSGSGGTYLALSAPLGVAIAPGDLQAVHLMSKCRLASDSISIKWENDRVAQVELNFISVPA